MASTDAINLDLLIKLLKKSQGDSDEESLLAIRAANKQLAKVGGDWESLLRGKVKIIADPFSNLPPVTVKKAEAPSTPSTKSFVRPEFNSPHGETATEQVARQRREARQRLDAQYAINVAARKIFDAAKEKARREAILSGPAPDLGNL